MPHSARAVLAACLLAACLLAACLLAACLLAGLSPGPAAAAERVCLAAPWQAAPETPEAGIAAMLDSLAPALERFPDIAGALERLAPELCLQSPLREVVGWLDPATPRITLSADAPEGLRLAVLLHEMRHLEQFSRGFCPDNVLTMRDTARATFALEADASAVSLAMAWHLRDTGAPAAWEALAAWPQQADIATAFAAAMAAGAELPAAVAAAFAQWYASNDRRRSYYAAACSDYLDREDTGHLLRGTARLDAGFFHRLCRMPDATPYPCAEPPQP